MSEKTLKLSNVEVNKKEFKHSDNGFKYFVGYKDDDIIRPLCIVLPQMSGYIK